MTVARAPRLALACPICCTRPPHTPIYRSESAYCEPVRTSSRRSSAPTQATRAKARLPWLSSRTRSLARGLYQRPRSRTSQAVKAALTGIRSAASPSQSSRGKCAVAHKKEEKCSQRLARLGLSSAPERTLEGRVAVLTAGKAGGVDPRGWPCRTASRRRWADALRR